MQESYNTSPSQFWKECLSSLLVYRLKGMCSERCVETTLDKTFLGVFIRQMEIKITAHHKGHFEFSICTLAALRKNGIDDVKKGPRNSRKGIGIYYKELEYIHYISYSYTYISLYLRLLKWWAKYMHIFKTCTDTYAHLRKNIGMLQLTATIRTISGLFHF